ncbi:hypothetical protein CBR_g6703 [Chara braunii]|uniref:Reverse transcriptase domain-containing protein n=1 Tax=Chara braunii TaxID=69332 RepID=A0A388KKL1_CHABU|nr:hypothetical protein CBR_g6703 [Chara braunii]|eukprot:GBG70576.1 hypothetical protein CBR_g6703 [Chara braunii]
MLTKKCLPSPHEVKGGGGGGGGGEGNGRVEGGVGKIRERGGRRRGERGGGGRGGGGGGGGDRGERGGEDGGGGGGGSGDGGGGDISLIPSHGRSLGLGPACERTTETKSCTRSSNRTEDDACGGQSLDDVAPPGDAGDDSPPGVVVIVVDVTRDDGEDEEEGGVVAVLGSRASQKMLRWWLLTSQNPPAMPPESKLPGLISPSYTAAEDEEAEDKSDVILPIVQRAGIDMRPRLETPLRSQGDKVTLKAPVSQLKRVKRNPLLSLERVRRRKRYHDVFASSFSYAGIPPMRDVEHSIQLVSDYRVHHQAPYRISIPETTELKRQLEELLRLGFIKPSNSPWGAPVLFARKADETLRLCIDYHGLNRYTVKNNYRMPRFDELFDRLAGNRFFTKIDLHSGYHQIRVAAADQPKTAFRSRFRHYKFTVMSFGLTNAPATFQRAMNDIFGDILAKYVLVYLDNILVYSRTLEEHLGHLRDVLDRLRQHGFYAKLSKCRFTQHKVDFLGHYVSDQGLHMDDAKITAIAEWPVPTSAKQLRSFLSLISYYSNFI